MMLRAKGVPKCEVTYWCIDNAVFVLTMKLFACYNYSYALSRSNRSTLDTVVSLFIFIHRSIPISIYLSQCTHFYLFIAVRIGKQLRVTGLFTRDRVFEGCERGLE